MAVAYTFRLDDQAVRGALDVVEGRGRDLTPPLRVIGRYGVRQTRARFATSRAPDGSPWKKGHKTSGLTLVASTLLRDSITDRPPSDDAVEWGSNRIYAGIHQGGGVIRAKTAKGLRFRTGGNKGWVTKQQVTIPARPYLGVNDENAAEFSQVLVDHIFGPIGAEPGQ